MIVITGAAGFIGSFLAGYLNEQGYNNLILVDDFSREDKRPNWEGKTFSDKIPREEFPEWFKENAAQVKFVFHLGARTDTSETDEELFNKLNYHYSQNIWSVCANHQIPLVYASSAATYGDGSLGYSDRPNLVKDLEPLNAYGRSKNEFDKWVLRQKDQPPFWAGLKFFNVYGPNEYHKGRMASVIFHAYHQYKKDGEVRLFRSHREDIAHGEQKRDFIYVKDVATICFWLLTHPYSAINGLYNIGTGSAETFLELANSLFYALEVEENIRFIDTPADIRNNYQYYTRAEMEKLRKAGYHSQFYSLREGVKDYVREFLLKGRYY